MCDSLNFTFKLNYKNNLGFKVKSIRELRKSVLFDFVNAKFLMKQMINRDFGYLL